MTYTVDCVIMTVQIENEKEVVKMEKRYKGQVDNGNPSTMKYQVELNRETFILIYSRHKTLEAAKNIIRKINNGRFYIVEIATGKVVQG